jgi:hypothetical protein
MRKRVLALVSVGIVVTGLAVAAPSLPITKPPLGPVPSWSGPPIDPHAISGQWFRTANGLEEVRPYEFHDNVQGFGGGFAGSGAIRGVVSMLSLDAAGNVVAFDVRASITNDTGGIGQWLEGGNSHGEYVVAPRTQWQGDMYDVKLSTSFADDGIRGNFPGPAGPYSGDEGTQNIFGMGYDQLGWYCWTPNNPDPQKVPWGDYMVPTWDFGFIPWGATVTRTLSFGLYNPVAPGTPQYMALFDAYSHQWDMFVNRTTSLKISNYFDAFTPDSGAPYPLPPDLSSNVSVFHNIPEPVSLIGLALGSVLLRRRR